MKLLSTCSWCKESFRTQSQLYNHVRRVHQTMVKVKFLNGEVKEIEKQSDEIFVCDCSKVFKHPGSLHNHAKQCVGVQLNDNRELAISLSRSGNSMNEYMTPESEKLGDSIGIWFLSLY